MYSVKNLVVPFLKGLVVALIFSLVSVLIFALVIEIFSVNFSIIKPVNLILKIIAVFIGVLVGVGGEKGLFKGLFLGLLISFCAFLLFGSIGGEITFSLSLLWEILLGGAIGAISGVVAVALKK